VPASPQESDQAAAGSESSGVEYVATDPIPRRAHKSTEPAVVYRFKGARMTVAGPSGANSLEDASDDEDGAEDPRSTHGMDDDAEGPTDDGADGAGAKDDLHEDNADGDDDEESVPDDGDDAEDVPEDVPEDGGNAEDVPDDDVGGDDDVDVINPIRINKLACILLSLSFLRFSV